MKRHRNLSIVTGSPGTIRLGRLCIPPRGAENYIRMRCGGELPGRTFQPPRKACFYGDAALLTCTACDIQPFEYARTSIPLIMVPTVLAAAGYLVLGFVMM